MRTEPINFRTRANQRLRASVYRRDDFTCQACRWRPEAVPVDYDGRFTVGGSWPHAAERILHIDHIQPRSAGAPSSVKNLQTLCEECNCRKGARPLPEGV